MILLVMVAIVSVGVLLIITGISASLYHKARKLNPYNLKKERIEQAIAIGQQQLMYVKQEIQKMQGEKLEVERIINRRKEMEDYINEYQAEYDKKVQEIENLEAQFDEISKKLADAEQELNVKNDEKSKLQEEYDKLEAGIHSDERDLAILKSDLETFENRFEKLKTDVIGLEECKSKLTNEVAELESRKKSLLEELDRINKEYSTAREALIETTGHLKATQLSEGIATKSAEHAEKIRWEDLDRPVVERISSPRKEKSESELLSDFKNALDRSHVIFSDRTIKAFHTGLKVEDISPLVVLAGISGTGKSLLPTLYARAFGFNMLSVAVQPRWDSPQDMFGFYNYMQSRYKATELSRLLWQYDIYNNSITKDEFSNEDELPMNIVLLDEMNLARVEYYFSDMLSKLEFRRDVINKADDTMRMKAEIEIEGGSIGDSEASRRLFVNGNTLFVGTMNEDETTQTLSDKVMDRSNVLRFGKPASLDVKVDLSTFDNIFKPLEDQYFSYGMWKKLCIEKSLSPKFEQRLDETVSNLNESLSTIGRPFAHRVWQSIKSYVTQYPDVERGNSESFKAALADQIEMKILPKLNGVDTSVPAVQKALVAIEGSISEVGDEGLTEAFRKVRASGSENTFFQWKGVERTDDKR